MRDEFTEAATASMTDIHGRQHACMTTITQGAPRPGTVLFNIQRFSLHDGDGIRTSVFFKGCPLRCAWCHNPESQRFAPELIFYEGRCIGCGRCAAFCPAQQLATALTAAGSPARAAGGDATATSGAGAGAAGVVQQAATVPYITEPDRSRCTGCGACVAACQYGAREVAGKPWQQDELLALLRRDAPFYETSGGGVTLSGGEPLAQDTDALEALLYALREAGISVTVDTCGYVPWLCFERVLPYVGLFLYDVKHIDDDIHRRFTGEGNALILENLARLGEAGAVVDVSVPVIGGFNANTRDMEAIAGAVKARIAPRRVRLLPYHNIGSGKLATLGRQGPDARPGPDVVSKPDAGAHSKPSVDALNKLSVDAFYTPDASEIEGFRLLFERFGFNTIIGG